MFERCQRLRQVGGYFQVGGGEAESVASAVCGLEPEVALRNLDEEGDDGQAPVLYLLFGSKDLFGCRLRRTDGVEFDDLHRKEFVGQRLFGGCVEAGLGQLGTERGDVGVGDVADDRGRG